MYYFIVNPNSRSGRGRSIWNEIHQQLMLRGIDFQYCLTRYSGNGVYPMLVSMDLPYLIAAMLAPLPK